MCENCDIDNCGDCECIRCAESTNANCDCGCCLDCWVTTPSTGSSADTLETLGLLQNVMGDSRGAATSYGIAGVERAMEGDTVGAATDLLLSTILTPSSSSSYQTPPPRQVMDRTDERKSPPREIMDPKKESTKEKGKKMVTFAPTTSVAPSAPSPESSPSSSPSKKPRSPLITHSFHPSASTARSKSTEPLISSPSPAR